MNLLVPLQHPDEVLDPPGAGLRLLRGLNPEEDRYRFARFSVSKKVFAFSARREFCSHASESWACFCPSIQPWQSAASTASAYETDVRALPFFAIISQTPGEDS